MHVWLRCTGGVGVWIPLWFATVDDDHCDYLSLRHKASI